MRFTITTLAAALLLTTANNAQIISNLLTMTNPYAGTPCNTLQTCIRGLTCYYNPATSPVPGTGVCYPTASPGRQCNTDSTNGAIVLCGQGQECAMEATQSGVIEICRQVETIGVSCLMPSEPISNWCERGQVCDPSDNTCRVPAYYGDPCDPSGVGNIFCVPSSPGTPGTCTLSGAIGYGTCSTGTQQRSYW